MIYLNDRIGDLDVESALPLLSEQRRQEALRYRRDLGRRTCVAAYLLLRQGLQQEYGIEEMPVFSYGEHGKPALVGYPHIHFNLSHCREAVACVLSDCPVGIDVESVGRYNEQVARYTMSDREMELILQAERPEMVFTRLWTMKEAVLKLSGEGLRDNLKDVLTGRYALGCEGEGAVSVPLITTVEAPDGRYVYSVVYESGGGK